MVNMNMIVSTSELVGYEAETKTTKASGTQALAKLISNWERKQASAKKVGGLGLLAISLAACNSDDSTSDADAAALAAVQAQLTAALAAQATAEAAQAAAEATAATATAATDAAAVVASSNQTFTYTTGVETFVGGDGDDNFNSGTAAKFGMLDGATGGAGTDTLSIADASAAAYSFPTNAPITGIETLVIQHGATANTHSVTADVSNYADVDHVNIGKAGTAADVTITTKENVTSVTVTGDANTASVRAVTITDSGTAQTALVAGTDVLDTVSVTGASTTVGVVADTLTTLNLQAVAGVTTVTDAYAASVRDLTVNIAKGALGGITDAGADTVTVNVNGVVTATGTMTFASATTINVNADNTVAGTLDGAATTALNISGDSLATLNVSTAATGAITVSGSAGLKDVTTTNAATITNSGTGAVTLGNVATTAGVAVGSTYTGGTGVDTITFGAQTKASTLGAGKDVAYFTGAALGAAGAVDLGDGVDTVGLTHANAITASNSEAFEGVVTNFEALTIAASVGTGTINMANMNSVDAVEFSGAIGHATVLSNMAPNSTVTYKVAATAATTHNLAVATGTTDVMNFVLTAAADANYNTVNAAGVETINITSTDSSLTAATQTAVHTVALGTAAATTISVSGNAGLAMGTGGVAVTSMDASGVSIPAASTTAVANAGKITFTSGNVTLTATPVISGGDGPDTLTGSSAAVAETINGNAGADIIEGNGGNDILNGGAGNDTFNTTGAELTGLDVIDGGDGTDSLVPTDATTITDAQFAGISNIETLALGTNLAHIVTLGATSKAAGIVTVTATGSGDDAITVGAGHTGAISITTAAGDDTLVVSAVPATNSATIVTGNGANAVTLGLGTETLTGGTGIETVTVGATTHLASTDNLNGAAGTDVITYSAAATLVDSAFSGVTNFETLTMSNNNDTITAGSQIIEAGIVTFNLGNGTNVLDVSAYPTGASGAISIVDGTGSSTITLGKGADTVTPGNGVDTLIFQNSGANNGTDVFGTNLQLARDANRDVFDFTSFLPGVTFAPTHVQSAGTADVNISGLITVLLTVDGDNAANHNDSTEIAAEIEGYGDALHMNAGTKAVLIVGDDSAAASGGAMYFVDDTLDGSNGVISATDVVKIATFQEDVIAVSAMHFV
jgi:S-layer protein